MAVPPPAPSIDLEAPLRKYWGFQSFRPKQREVIEACISGKRDCFVCMATASGKSLCYQLPPVVLKKTAFVVSPLISLMTDQVLKLDACNVKAT